MYEMTHGKQEFFLHCSCQSEIKMDPFIVVVYNWRYVLLNNYFSDN